MRSSRNSLVSLFGLAMSAALEAQKPIPSMPTFGTSAITYVQVPAEAFGPNDSFTTFSAGSGATRYSFNCVGFCFAAPLQLPAGAKIVYLELDFGDIDPAHFVVGMLAACDYLGHNCTYHPSAGAGPVDCLTTGQLCSGTAFASGQGNAQADMSADGVTVDNYLGSYRLYAGGGGSPATEIGGMIVGYVLQVSPAPGTATFNDVPTSHPFFQFIEALHKSGITAGCSASPLLYCPDAPLTRGQMAVFLAKALGLQWR